MDRGSHYTYARGNVLTVTVRMAHGYFDINLDVVWETVQEWLPALLKQLPVVRQDADDEDRNGDGMES